MRTSTGVRPVVHFAPRTGWMNDPHGIVFREGRYHLFFQHLPDSLVWRPDICWGHAVSDDLVQWEQLPDALSPVEDEDGCWSGSLAIDDDGNAVILYTSVGGHDHQLGRVRAAFPTDDTWLSWKQGAVVAEAPRSETVVFRDPAVFRDGNRWRMVVGFGDADGTAGAEVFVADDLTDWAYDGTLATRHGSEQDPWTGVAWECPQLLFPAADRSVLVESSWENHRTNEVVAAVGAYADALFEAKLWQQLTAGAGHYAATRFLDAEGRECLLFWIRGISDEGVWAGAASVPYTVDVENDTIRLAPHPAVARARGEVGADRPGTSLDIEWHPGAGSSLRLQGTRGQLAEVFADDGRITVTVEGVAHPVTVAHRSDVVRIIVDGQVLEVVGDGGLIGLPVLADAHGVLPITDLDSHLTWWHLG